MSVAGAPFRPRKSPAPPTFFPLQIKRPRVAQSCPCPLRRPNWQVLVSLKSLWKREERHFHYLFGPRLVPLTQHFHSASLPFHSGGCTLQTRYVDRCLSVQLDDLTCRFTEWRINIFQVISSLSAASARDKMWAELNGGAGRVSQRPLMDRPLNSTRPQRDTTWNNTQPPFISRYQSVKRLISTLQLSSEIWRKI